MQSIKYTPEGAVYIEYNDLVNSPLELTDAIEAAFGSTPEALGIIIVKNLPGYVDKRERLLKLAHKFASLDEKTREKYSDPQSRYSFGWSHGKEIMNGIPDTLKGSYYNNPLLDEPKVSPQDRTAHPEYYNPNIWPQNEPGVEGFEDAFKDLGRFVFKVGTELAVACQPFVSSYLTDNSITLPELITRSQTVKARLLHYFPPTENVEEKDEPIDSYCGWHKDSSMLTGLASAMYLDGTPEKIVDAPSSRSGLYIRTRGGKLTKVSIPKDCLAFQTGEVLEIATGGKLVATPHCVAVGGGKDSVSRETFALFMQPDTSQRISPTQTFGNYSTKVFDEHYEKEVTVAA